MTDSKTPDWAETEAKKLWAELGFVNDRLNQTPAISQALLSAYERGRADAVEALPDEIDLYQMLKRAGLRKRADVAKFVARAIQGERQ